MKKIAIILSLLISLVANSQTIISPERAVEISLQNNYNIRIYKNLSSIDSIENNISNAGFVPTINLATNVKTSSTHLVQDLSSGAIIDYNNLNNNTLNTGVELNWNIFDGGKMFIEKQKLDEYQDLGELELKNQVLQTSFEVLQVYYSIVMQKELLRSIDTLISFNTSRLEITQAKFASGNISKTEVIQAQIDLNLAKTSNLKQSQIIAETKLLLLDKMGWQLDLKYEVIDSISSSINLDFNTLKQKTNTNNLAILSYEKQKSIALLNLNMVKRNYLPTINLNAGYYFGGYSNSEGSVYRSRSLGPEIGASLNIPIYNAGETRRNAKIAIINLDNQEIELQKLKSKIMVEVETILNEYAVAEQSMVLEAQNLELAKNYLEISKLRLQQGQATTLEVHQAQVEYIGASSRLLNLKMDKKLAELKLLQLAAEI